MTAAVPGVAAGLAAGRIPDRVEAGEAVPSHAAGGAECIRSLLPRPREVWLEDPARVVPPRSEPAMTGLGPDSPAWQALADLCPGDLPPEGYALRITVADGRTRAIIAAADAAGRAHGLATLSQLEAAGSELAALTIRDWPELGMRGVVEGFYGGPWSHEARLEFLRFAGRVKLNTFIYAPKDEPYHRDRWRELYPAAQLDRLCELAEVAAANGVQFVYALAPGLSMRYSHDSEHECLAAKAEQLWQAGIRSFALLFDDVPVELTDADDIERFGAGAEATGRAHGIACARFDDGFLIPHGILDPVLMCPTDYSGCAASPYRSGLAATLPLDARILWTGSDIVVGGIGRAELDGAVESYRREIVLWDNFPVNDFDRTRLFLGPLQGRTGDVQGSGLRGIAANPMVEAAPSRFALASMADWAWNGAAYDPSDSARRALTLVAGADAPTLGPLVAACSAWPPSAPQSSEISALVEAALTHQAAALDALESALGKLAASGEGHAFDPQTASLSRELDPWVAAARDVGRAGSLACRLLRRIQSGHGYGMTLEVEGLRRAQAEAERHYPNVLRSVLPAFVRSVLERAGLERKHTERAQRITVLIGANPDAGDRELSERLSARGFDVTLTSRVETREALESVDLVIITRGAALEAARAAAAAAVPAVAWGHLQALGLASASAVGLSRDSIEITDPGSPLAAGLKQRVRVYRGAGKITWGEPSPQGRVIAQALDTGLPVIVHYPAGAMLPDGSIARAARVTTFLGSEGLAPWLLSPDGRALVDAAVDHLLSGC